MKCNFITCPLKAVSVVRSYDIFVGPLCLCEEHTPKVVNLCSALGASISVSPNPDEEIDFGAVSIKDQIK
jgi:hypothetical protein